MKAGEYGQFMMEKGSVAVPVWLLERLQTLNIAPEELGILILAMHRARILNEASGVQQGKDPWIGWALGKGWAVWEGEKERPRVAFTPLWNKLYQVWEEEEKDRAGASQTEAAKELNRQDFDYCSIIKELDKLKGSLSVTAREKQLIQELNIKYGWSTDFIITFYRLVFQRGLTQVRSYKPLAERLHRAGILTIDGLVRFMDEVDWISQKAAEIKKDYLGLYGMVTVTERELYVKWHVAWKLSHSVIARGARETVGAANASFKYLDRILEDWYRQGVSSLEDCEEILHKRQAEKDEQKLARAEKAKASEGFAQRPGRANRTEQRQEKGRESIWAGYEEE
ncbi:MAG: DnaD domain protein [Peptococcaceae bacterium]|nr:DnaD domain protein [Peptococcaceae bacterium]